MLTYRLSARPGAASAAERRQQDVVRRFFDLIGKLERPRPPGGIAPEVKARISRLDEAAPRRHS